MWLTVDTGEKALLVAWLTIPTSMLVLVTWRSTKTDHSE
jgi:hypothetical protein